MTEGERQEMEAALDAMGLSPAVKQALRDIRTHLEDMYRASIDKLTTQLESERKRVAELEQRLAHEPYSCGWTEAPSYPRKRVRATSVGTS